MTDLEKAGISMEQITTQLLDDAIKLFDEAFEKLIAAVAAKKDSSQSAGLAAKAKMQTQSAALPRRLSSRLLTPPSRIGLRTTRSIVSGSAISRSGPMMTKINGSAG